jgi:hypothetical protein
MGQKAFDTFATEKAVGGGLVSLIVGREGS